MAKSELNWTNLDVPALPLDVQKAYHGYKAAYKLMKDARNEFETALAQSIDVPNGHRVVFGYNFGKLSVALAPDDVKLRTATKPAASLADWISAQRDANRNC